MIQWTCHIPGHLFCLLCCCVQALLCSWVPIHDASNPFNAADSRWTYPCRSCFSRKKPYHKQLDNTSVLCSAGECPEFGKEQSTDPQFYISLFLLPDWRVVSFLCSFLSKGPTLNFLSCFLNFLMSNQNLSLQLDMTKCLVPKRILVYFTEQLPAVHFPSIIKAILVFLTCLDIHLHDICRTKRTYVRHLWHLCHRWAHLASSCLMLGQPDTQAHYSGGKWDKITSKHSKTFCCLSPPQFSFRTGIKGLS